MIAGTHAETYEMSAGTGWNGILFVPLSMIDVSSFLIPSVPAFVPVITYLVPLYTGCE